MKLDYRELLASMCPHGIEIGKPFGGIPTLTGLDVAAAVGMGNLTRGQSLLLLVKYCDDQDLFRELFIRWYHTVVLQGVKEGWKIKKYDRGKSVKPRVASLAMYSLTEDLSALHCTICEGRKTVMVSDLQIGCPVCKQVGRVYPTDREVARRLQMHHKTFQQVWRPRLMWCRHELAVWDMHAIYEIGKCVF